MVQRFFSIHRFKSSPVSWRAHVSASEGKRQMFADLLSDRPSKKPKRGALDGGETVAHDTPENVEHERSGDGEIVDREDRVEGLVEKRKRRKGKGGEEGLDVQGDREEGSLPQKSDGGDKEVTEGATRLEKKGKKANRREGMEGDGLQAGVERGKLLEEVSGQSKRKIVKDAETEDQQAGSSSLLEGTETESASKTGRRGKSKKQKRDQREGEGDILIGKAEKGKKRGLNSLPEVRSKVVKKGVTNDGTGLGTNLEAILGSLGFPAAGSADETSKLLNKRKKRKESS